MASQAWLSPTAAPSRARAPAPAASPFTVAAMVARVPEGALPLPMAHDGMSAAAASYRVLAHRLRRGSDPAVVTLTGAERRTGTTTTAANLAFALAEQSADGVLLIEANRLYPRLAVALGIDVPACFEAQLASALSIAEPEWWTTKVVYDTLHVLALDSGRHTGRSLPASVYQTLIRQARAAYGHVIVDGPAISSGADLSELEDLADGVLVCAQAGRTRGPKLVSAVDQLAPKCLLGVVLSGADP